jgi:hypothetical protein
MTFLGSPSPSQGRDASRSKKQQKNSKRVEVLIAFVRSLFPTRLTILPVQLRIFGLPHHEGAGPLETPILFRGREPVDGNVNRAVNLLCDQHVGRVTLVLVGVQVAEAFVN